MQNTTKWIQFFHRNQLNRPEPHWQAPVALEGTPRRLLEQSLAEFQLGDGGGPASLIAWNAVRWQKSQKGMQEVVSLWFEEEKGHSKLLSGLLERFQKPPITGHWSFSLFCWLRYACGVQMELQILTLTELSSTAYYRLLRHHGNDVALQDVCSLILRDEGGHVAFQNDRLYAKLCNKPAWLRGLWKAQFLASGYLAATVLYISHGKCLRALGATVSEFYAEITRQFGRFTHRLDRRVVLAVKRTA